MGARVNLTVQAIKYKGKTYGFCCPACISNFQADPEKYIKRLSKDGKSLIEKS